MPPRELLLLVPVAIGVAAIAAALVVGRRAVPVALLGAAFVVGPLAPLLQARLSDSAQVAMSISAIVMAGTGTTLGVLRARTRKTH